MVRKIYLTLSLLVLVMSFGCVRTNVSVNSEPTGATVFFDGQEKGVTPLEFELDWYGWHKFQLRKEEFAPIDKLERIKAPVYLWIPLDLFVSILPIDVNDKHEFNFSLEKKDIDGQIKEQS